MVPIDCQDEDLAIFDGLLLAINEESGPMVSLNLSSLDEREAIGTAVHGITAVGLGINQTKGLFGPIPVPYNTDYRALMFVFTVTKNNSDDKQFCSLFLIFKKERIRFIASVYAMIESLLNLYQENYLFSVGNLQDETIEMIYNELITKLKIQPRIRLFRINDGITIEFENSKIMLGNELTAIICEQITTIYTYTPRSLDKEEKVKALAVIKEINELEYQDSFEIKKINSKKKFIDLLEDNQIVIIEQ
jgi:hypothetical protein